MQIFESNDNYTISTTALKYGDFGVSTFLKIDTFEGAKSHSPLTALRSK